MDDPEFLQQVINAIEDLLGKMAANWLIILIAIAMAVFAVWVIMNYAIQIIAQIWSGIGVVARIPWKRKENSMPDHSNSEPPRINVTSIEQQGGITAGVVNIQPESEPTITLSDTQYRQTDSGHLHEAMLRIDSRYPIPELRIVARANSIQSFDVVPQRGGMHMSGHSGKREGYHFTTLQYASGNYRVKVVTSEPETVKIDLG